MKSNNMEEIWKDIKDYEGYYQISDKGRIKSLERIDSHNQPRKEKILKPAKNTGGYLQIELFKNGKHKHYSIHRLVAEAFIPNPLKLPQVNHKNEDKTLNTVDNLEWCDITYNCNYGTRTDRCVKSNINHPNKSRIVLQIDLNSGEILNEWTSTMEVQRQLGFANSNISACCLGKYRQAYGFKWKYK